MQGGTGSTPGWKTKSSHTSQGGKKKTKHNPVKYSI